jgi:hypothetical protein
VHQHLTVPGAHAGADRAEGAAAATTGSEARSRHASGDQSDCNLFGGPRSTSGPLRTDDSQPNCVFGALGRTRTCNLLIRSQVLYPLSYERTGRLPAPTGPGYLDGWPGVKLGRWSGSIA